MMWQRLVTEGASMHSAAGATIWAVEELCKRNGRAYKVLHARDELDDVVRMLVKFDTTPVERERAGFSVTELRSWPVSRAVT